jgi:DNA-binding NtrC family response regulator
MRTEQILIPNENVVEGFLIPLGGGGTAVTVGDLCTIGRDGGCDISVADPFVSSRHARIEKRGGSFMLRDLQSRNGTFLNGTKIIESTLALGDKLKIGESTFVFSETSSAAPGELTSKNAAWSAQLRRLPAFASTDFPVLITGPSGSGKEILASALHRLSKRSQGEFVALNCSTMSEHLIESELFGHKKGSFTGALHDRKGAFEAARGGTLFLDEIGDFPLALQPKLLRALEANEIKPVGSDRRLSTDVRIIAATHKNLVQAVRDGRFREDLYYRLNVCHLRPPALRERLEDFDDLLYSFARQFRVRFSFGAISAMKGQAWQGNIRELKNVVARASAYFPGELVKPSDLQALFEPAPEPAGPRSVFERASLELESQNSVIKQLERDIIIRRLVANQGNQRRTAKDLGMAKSTLHDRIRHYDIDLKLILAPDGADAKASERST